MKEGEELENTLKITNGMLCVSDNPSTAKKMYLLIPILSEGWKARGVKMDSDLTSS